LASQISCWRQESSIWGRNGGWQLATGNWRLATGGWQAARGLKMNVFQSISTYFFLLRLATGNWRLASCTWLNDEPISKYFNLFLFTIREFVVKTVIKVCSRQLPEASRI
jgi:hypothetical protein